MTGAAIARIGGDDYQARFFWLQVCRLFEPHSKVKKVGYEVNDVRSFDDVVVSYDPPVNDDRGGTVAADHFQVKFHVNQQGTIRFESLMDPGFINAATVSLLQRLRDAYWKTKARGGCRFTLVTPWGVDPDDPLARLVNNNAGQLHLDRLYAGGTRSRMGLLRRNAAEHLTTDEDTLHEILATLRIHASSGALSDLNSRLADKLMLAGMKSTPLTGASCVYDDLVRKMLVSGRNTFTAEDIRELCEREGLWTGRASAPDHRADLGIRSFVRRAEYIEDETDAVLDLVPYFSGRAIRDPALWNSELAPDVARFLGTSARTGSRYRLRLDAHVSIAVLAGYELDTKSGVDISLVQKTRSGIEVWDTGERPAETFRTWQFAVSEGSCIQGDLAVAVSVTHDVKPDVDMYLSTAGLKVRELLVAELYGLGSTAIRDARHALALAQALISELRKHRQSGQTVHIFMAAPNGFAFLLGQQLRAVGSVMVYEFDFEAGTPGAYSPGVGLPIGSESIR